MPIGSPIDSGKKGVKPETIVGIFTGNPANSVIAILGVLKAGGAYAPLNPNDPPKRLHSHLRNAQIRHLIVDSQSSLDLEIANGHIFNLDRDLGSTDPLPLESLGVEIHLKNLAYVIHTSGSTGEPKSVAMGHESFSNLISWHTRTLGGENLRTLLFTPFSFDASNQELFSTICVGGILYLIDDSIRHDPFELLSFIQEKRIGRILLFFAPLQNFIIAANEQELSFPHLCDIITAGEPIKITSQLLHFFLRNNTCRFVNMYGLSETHTVTCFLFPHNPETWPGNAPIGFPISRSNVNLLDDKYELAEKGESGEIYVSGVCLARGYLNRPDLTAEKYLPCPYGDTPGDRTCRTGDVGKRLSDGTLECLGRRDHQVKIRGYRVELSEVEAIMARHPCVNKTIVVARTRGGNESLDSQNRGEDPVHSQAVSLHLVAYVVVSLQQEVSIPELRAYLQEHLPQYMIPSSFVFLEKFPLSKNGKVDRNLLPVPKMGEAYHEVQEGVPRNPIEQVLLGLWENFLELENLGIHDHFFGLGGDSLAATRLISEIRKLFQCELGVQSLFENPTVEEFEKKLAAILGDDQKILNTAELILRIAELSEEEVDQKILHQN